MGLVTDIGRLRLDVLLLEHKITKKISAPHALIAKIYDEKKKLFKKFLRFSHSPAIAPVFTFPKANLISSYD